MKIAQIIELTAMTKRKFIQRSTLPALIITFGLIGATLFACSSGSSGSEPTSTAVVASESVPVPSPTLIATPVAPTAPPTATIAPAPTIEATATSTATPSPSATPTTEVESLTDYVDDLTERTYDLTIMLAEELSPRQSATAEELRAAMFLLDEMEALGYTAELQQFEVTEASPGGSIEVLVGEGEESPRVQFSGPDGDTSRIFYLPFEPPKTGSVQGELVYVGLGDDIDYEGVDVEGKIALVSRGTLTFEEKENNAAERGALGIVVFNNEPRFYFAGRLSGEPEVLAGGIPK